MKKYIKQLTANTRMKGARAGALLGALVLCAGAVAFSVSLLSVQSAGETLTQRAYIFLNDDSGTVDQYTARAGVATSTAITGVKKGERLVVRIQIDNTGTGTSTAQYRLQYDKNDNTWVDVGTTTEIRSSLSIKGALWGRPDGVPLTSKQVTASCSASTVFTAGRFVAGTATSTAFDIGINQCTEIVYVIETSGATLGQLYRLRVIQGSANIAFTTYSTYPTLTIESARTISYSKEARGAWTASTLASVDSVGTSTAMAIGMDGFPVIAYFDDTGNDLEFLKCGDAACSSGNSTSTLDSSIDTTNGHISIAIGSDGFPVVSYYDDTNDLGFYKCDNIACSSGTASKLDTTNDAGKTTSVAIGSDGFPVISYQLVTNRDLGVAKCNNLACTSVTLSNVDAAAAVVVQDTSIAIGSDGFPAIAYGDSGPNDLRFAKCNNASCSSAATSSIEVLGGGVDEFVSIAIGSDGFPVVAAYDRGVGLNLRFVKCNDAACTAPTDSILDSLNDAGKYTSLAIGTDGYPLLSYYGITNGNLMLAKCNNVSCSSVATSTLDSTGDVGKFTSLAIGTDGFPVISYQDTTAGDLKFLKCNSIDCATAASASGNLPNTSASLSTYLDDGGYTNAATSDDLYDTLAGATSTKLAYNFKKYNSDTNAEITVTWEGQVTVSTTTSLQLYNYTTASWTNLQINSSPTGGSDFTLTGTQSTSLSDYYSGNIVTARAVTGTTTQATVLKTDRIAITFGPTPTLTQKDYRWYANADAIQPGASLQSENVAHTLVSTGTPIRLRQNISVTNQNLATGTQAFKLQYAYSTAGPWTDVGAEGGGEVKKTFCASGCDYGTGTTTWQVPAGVTSIAVKAWGAGGGGGGGGTGFAGGAGGGGGAASSTSISVTPEENLDVVVGSNGVGGPANPTACGGGGINGGGCGGDDGDGAGGGGGGGGGYSAVKRSDTFLIQAGAGGGGGGGGQITSAGAAGGAGGGTSGVDGSSAGGTGGGRGTSVSGGTGGGTGGTVGVANSGGDGGNSTSADGHGGGGGGGAGRYGGGGGGYATDVGAGGGGGGSGLGANSLAGSGTTAGGSTDADYAGSAGQGGSAGAVAGNGGNGNAGRVVIIYTAGAATWAFKDNTGAGVTDGATTTATLLSASDVNESYEESNNTAANLNIINVGQEGEWDFALDPTNATATTYYFRMVKSDGTALDGHTNYPALTVSVSSGLTQFHYRWRYDDGSESLAGYNAAEDSNPTDVFVGDRRRLRFVISNTGSGNAENITYRLQYASTSCSAWYDVPTAASLNWQEWAMDLTQYALDSAATTNLAGLTDPGGKSFVAGRLQSLLNQTAVHNLTASQFTEHEYSLRSTQNASIGVTYCFRLTNAGSTTNFSYSVEPQVSFANIERVSRGGGGSEGGGSGSQIGGGAAGGGGGSEGGSSGGGQVGGGAGGGGGGSE